MIDKELLRKIQKIKITTRHLVSASFSGEYESAFKGKGMEFDEVREYQPGDDVRTIDWNVTARTGHPHIKRYIEERELTLIFALDLSASHWFGSSGKSKKEAAAEIIAALSFAAGINNDKVGLLLFTDKIERYIPPGKGSNHFLRLIREVLSFHPTGKTTSLSTALNYLNKVQKRKAVIFLISDFYDQNWLKPLKITGKRHDLIGIRILDSLEEDLAYKGIVSLYDPEQERSIAVDLSSKKVQHWYKKKRVERKKELKSCFHKSGIDYLELPIKGDWVQIFSRFMIARELRKGK